MIIERRRNYSGRSYIDRQKIFKKKRKSVKREKNGEMAPDKYFLAPKTKKKRKKMSEEERGKKKERRKEPKIQMKKNYSSSNNKCKLEMKTEVGEKKEKQTLDEKEPNKVIEREQQQKQRRNGKEGRGRVGGGEG